MNGLPTPKSCHLGESESPFWYPWEPFVELCWSFIVERYSFAKRFGVLAVFNNHFECLFQVRFVF